MKYIVIVLFSIFSFSQVEEPVSWSFEVNELEKGGYVLKIIAKINPGWHIYSQYKEPDSFMRETSFYFEKDDVKGVDFLDGDVQIIKDFPFVSKNGDPYRGLRVIFSEPEPIIKYLDFLDSVNRYFEDEAVFVQQIILNEPLSEIKGMLEYMACNNYECLPPQIVNFLFLLNSD